MRRKCTNLTILLCFMLLSYSYFHVTFVLFVSVVTTYVFFDLFCYLIFQVIDFS
jgi:hypothetical protein